MELLSNHQEHIYALLSAFVVWWYF